MKLFNKFETMSSHALEEILSSNEGKEAYRDHLIKFIIESLIIRVIYFLPLI